MYKLLPVVLLFCACTNAATNTDISKDTVPSSQTIHNNSRDTVVTNKKPLVLNGCYEMILKHDTAILQLNVKDSTVTGELSYNFYQKDDNTGTLNGVLRNDTIYADYTFRSEGMTSVREVVFKIQDSTLLQGFGNMAEQGGKVVYQDRNNLQFQTANPFLKIRCQ
jgi:hypothetical protein